ncbi:MAG: AzlC family ABC transporter permease [Lachnospiraceae bacterium]|nr:AzlC family ABC transporter permease [Lachnospiraceae bacterium]
MNSKQIFSKKLLYRAIKDTIPVMTGYIVLGMGFGILLRTKGYGIGWTLGMSLFIYAGSMQYLTIDLLTGGVSLVAAALTTLLVNARHLFYGISMVDRYKNTGRKKPYLIFALTDETYSLVCGESTLQEKERTAYYFLVSLLNQIYWVTGSLLGAILQQMLSFNTEGIDFALTALFVTIFVEQWITAKEHRQAVLGVVVSVICLVIFGPDHFLIPSMVGITLGLLGMRKEGSRNE